MRYYSKLTDEEMQELQERIEKSRRIKTRERLSKLEVWHNWFAWLPVYVEEDKAYVWLERVHRRAVLSDDRLRIVGWRYDYYHWYESCVDED